MEENMVNLDELEAMMTQTKVSLSRFIYGMIKHKEITEEIFQETWLRVVWHLNSYNGNLPFKPWLFRIARNLCLNHLKQAKQRHQKCETLEAEHNETLQYNSPIELKVEVEKLLKHLSELPIKFRDVLHLRFFDDMPLGEIAGVLNVPVGTVNSRINRGLKHLRKRWEEKNEA
jgi:RNA polymerase sigma-70 factor (ECF subfamily)